MSLSQQCRTELGPGLLGDVFIDVLSMLRALGWGCLGASSSSEHVKRTALLAAAATACSGQPKALRVRQSVSDLLFSEADCQFSCPFLPI